MGEISSKPTVNDIARVAGVSLATVDRVINARPGVRGVTIERVNNAIQQLGYVRDTAAATLARGRVYNFIFILPAGNNEFVASLETQINEYSKSLAADRTALSVLKVEAFDPRAMAGIINNMDPDTVDGITRRAGLAKLYNRIARYSISRRALLAVGPFFQVIAQRAAI